MKVNWLMDDLAVRSQVGVESDEFRVIFDIFWPTWGTSVVKVPVCAGSPIREKVKFGHTLKKREWLMVNVTAVGAPPPPTAVLAVR